MWRRCGADFSEVVDDAAVDRLRAAAVERPHGLLALGLGIGFLKQAVEYTGENAEIVQKIKSMIETYVKPAVEMDGGNIEFRSFENGVVTLAMQGSCSGCPSSTVTLKSGIEGMMKRMIPEVKEVVAYAG